MLLACWKHHLHWNIVLLTIKTTLSFNRRQAIAKIIHENMDYKDFRWRYKLEKKLPRNKEKEFECLPDADFQFSLHITNSFDLRMVLEWFRIKFSKFSCEWLNNIDLSDIIVMRPSIRKSWLQDSTNLNQS